MAMNAATSSSSIPRVQSLTAAVDTSRVSALVMKLTDEALAALQKAHRCGYRLHLNVDAQRTGGTLDIGDESMNQFRFCIQQLPGGQPVDAVRNRPSKDGYRSIAALTSKLQVDCFILC